MKFKKALSLIVLTAASEAPSWAAEGVISKVVLSSGYCHLKFPAIQEETLHWTRPLLKDDGDIIDCYDHDPLGKADTNGGLICAIGIATPAPTIKRAAIKQHVL